MKLKLWILFFCVGTYTYAKIISDAFTLTNVEKGIYKAYNDQASFQKGKALFLEGNYDRALQYFKVAVKKNPYHYSAIEYLSNMYWILGNVQMGALGWANLAYIITSKSTALDEKKSKLWQGQDLKGKTVLVKDMWGIGDSFLLLRYLKLLKDRGAKVIFKTRTFLHAIFAQCSYIDKLLTHEQTYYNYDYLIPLVSLPYYFKIAPDNFPIEIPYIKADTKLIKKWRNILAKDTNFKIGICWKAAERPLYPAMALKSIPLQKFGRLFEIPNVSIYSLQFDKGAYGIATFRYNKRLKVFPNDFDKAHGSFMDTAAVMKNLDLVITVDTSVCHLAGALGVNVWTLLPFICDGRSFKDRKDNPWYPTMKLIRQPAKFDWDSVIVKVEKKIIALMANLPKK